MLLFLNGMNTPNLSYTYPYNTGIKTNFDNTSLAPTDEIVKIMNNWSPPKPQIMIAHSHGAMRGLAYIKSMGVNADRIKGFISIDGLLKGNEIIRGGLNNTGGRVSHALNTLIDGVESMVSAGTGPIGNFLYNALVDNHKYIIDTLQIDSNQIIADIFRMSKGELPHFFSAEMLSQVDPNSSFCQNYLGSQFDATSWSKIIPDHVFVGQIVGLNNDPLYFAGSPGDLGYDIANISKIAIELGLALSYGKLLADTTTVAAYSLVWGWVPWVIELGEWYAMQANYSRDALDWVYNYKENFGDLLGDRENDCLVPKKCQMRGINELGGRPIDVVDWQFTITNMIHNCNLKLANNVHPEVWGTNGGLVSRTINPGGKIYDWFVLRGWKVDSSKMNY